MCKFYEDVGFTHSFVIIVFLLLVTRIQILLFISQVNVTKLSITAANA